MSKVWKIFIEMDSIGSAIDAKKQLDNFKIFTDGSCMNIFFSNLDYLQFRNDYSGGVDYTKL